MAVVDFLVVEDEEVVALLIERSIKEVTPKAIVLKCRTGAEALTALQENECRSMILDIGLPDMNGADLLDAAHPKNVTVLTACDDPDTETRCCNAGATEYVVKPPDLNDLMDCVRRMVFGIAHTLLERNYRPMT